MRGHAGGEFLVSAECIDERVTTPDPAAVLAERARAYPFSVEEIRLDEVPRWSLGDSLRHDTGRFFSVEGLVVETNFGHISRWTQPIIMQPEIGILGFLVQRRSGVLHLLAQAKMEPGNRSMVQFAPTVQATPSNYLRVHGGRPTPYLEHFVGASRARVVVDVLQSEQGTRYYRKRNRNMIVEVPPDVHVPVGPDYAWLTLGQVRQLLARGNSVNMNGRTVLSCVYFDGADPSVVTGDGFRRSVVESQLSGESDEQVQEHLTWLADIKTDMSLDTRRIPLGELEHWIYDGASIRHETGRFFRVLGVSVTAASREIGSWSQPMISPTQHGSVAFLCQRRRGELQFLVQAKVEPGLMDSVELGATLQLCPGNYGVASRPPFFDYLDCPDPWVRLRSEQSDDGGRFYHDETTHLVIELPDSETLEVPVNYRWMTLGALKKLMRRGYSVTIGARSLIACLG